jgi:thioredoxin 1
MGANVIHTDDQGFEKTVLQAEQPVLVDFWAEWCGPCRMVGPIVEDLAGEYAGKLRTVKVDVDQSPEVAGRYGITGIPSLLFFNGGEEVNRVVGALPKPRLKAVIEQVLAQTSAPAK